MEKELVEYIVKSLVDVPDAVEVNVVEGENVVEFTASGKPLNPDYMDIKTSANLTYSPAFSIGKFDDVFTVTTEPTMTSTGTLTAKCPATGCEATKTFTLPALTSEFYSVNNSTYSVTIYGKKINFYGN